MLRLEEPVEARPWFDALFVDPHDLAFRSHRTWMRGRRDLLRMDPYRSTCEGGVLVTVSRS